MKKVFATIVMLLLTTLFVFPVYAAPKNATQVVPMTVGETTKLSFKIKGVNKKKIKWTSSKKSVATVKNGKVEAKKPGTTTIVAKYRNKKKKFIIIVNPRPEERPEKPALVEPTPTPPVVPAIIVSDPTSPTTTNTGDPIPMN